MDVIPLENIEQIIGVLGGTVIESEGNFPRQLAVIHILTIFYVSKSRPGY